MRVYYMCAIQYAVSNIALRRIKISRYNDLNDPFELLSVVSTDSKIREGLARGKKVMHERFGCLCFTKSWSDPVIWAHYADKHYGAALGFDIADDLIEPIGYVDERFTLVREPNDSKPKLDAQAAANWMWRKYAGWELENEVRASVPIEPGTQQAGLYFSEFSEQLQLREVILGVRCELPIAEMQRLVSTFQPIVEVAKAGLAQDAFRIVREGAS